MSGDTAEFYKLTGKPLPNASLEHVFGFEIRGTFIYLTSADFEDIKHTLDDYMVPEPLAPTKFLTLFTGLNCFVLEVVGSNNNKRKNYTMGEEIKISPPDDVSSHMLKTALDKLNSVERKLLAEHFG